MDELRLRPAGLADLPTLRRWDEQFIAEVDGRSIGFLQIIDPQLEESHYWGDCGANLRAIDIWIGEADCLGRGYGSRLMRLALARCFEAPSVVAVFIDPLASNTRAIRFYERLGFRLVGRRRFGLDECLVYRLDREDWHGKD
ncbi:MAG: GNAT family N-acetyltransferase [Steroidobacteraceae bacterium]